MVLVMLMLLLVDGAIEVQSLSVVFEVRQSTR